MAKAKLSSLITSISGSIGKHSYTTHRGAVYIRKKTESYDSKTPLQMKIREIWKESMSTWELMPLKKRALWEFYAKYITISKITIGNLMKKKPPLPRRMSGMNVYCAINQLLLSSELHRIEKPPSTSIISPPTPATNIIQSGTYHNKIKFEVWLPHSYDEKCVAKICLNVRKCISNLYHLPPTHLSTKPTLIEIKKVKTKQKQGKKIRVVEVELKELRHPIIQLQMMTVAQNGKFSLPSQIYTIEVFNS